MLQLVLSDYLFMHKYWLDRPTTAEVWGYVA